MANSLSTINSYLPTTFGGIQVYISPEDMRKVNNVDRFIKDSPRILRKSFRLSVEDFGMSVVNAAKSCIMSGRPPRGVSWPPLSKDYVRSYKNFKHGDTLQFWWNSRYIYSRIGIYTQGAEIWGTKEKATQFYIGLPLQATHPHHGYPESRRTPNLTLQKIAKFIENGVGDVPPRPLFKPLFYQMGGNDKLKKTIRQNIQKQITPYF